MVNRQVVNSKLRKDIQDLYRTAYNNGGKYVEESALLQRTIRNLFPYLSNAGLAKYVITFFLWQTIYNETKGITKMIPFFID